MAPAIEIPEKLALSNSRIEAAGPVSELVATIGAILEQPRMPFFPGYTDHSAKHVSRLLATAAGLIPTSLWDSDTWTAEDSALLVASAILHDAAMHIEPQGFLALIEGQTGHRPDPWFAKTLADKPWPVLWESFQFEVKRWDERERVAIAGEAADVRVPSTNPDVWVETDRLVIGEFLRRHHARLAHEIALQGFPGLEPFHLDRFFGGRLPFADLAGIVARSHGMDLRVAVRYLRERHGSDSRPHGVIATFLMALLRISDYLQLESDRAPVVLLHLREPVSPVARAEWEKHRSVAYVGEDDRDPRAIHVHVSDGTPLTTFLGLEKLLRNLQRELDTTAAVLRETYALSPMRGMPPVEIQVSRISSNIFARAFRAALPYVPLRTQFRTRGFELLPMLIKPLYRGVTAAGIRELVQNAVDAVRELQWLTATKRLDVAGVNAQRMPIDGDVLLQLRTEKDGAIWLEVSDAGVGMTEEVLRKYFFTVGVSYRRSANWRQQFEDSTGRASVLRSGRFGIGVLAAFLLGDEIELETRHYSAAGGLHLKASLHSDPVEILRADGLPIGTRVRIRLNEEARQVVGGRTLVQYKGEGFWDELGGAPERVSSGFFFDNWDWYAMSSPRVVRRLTNGEKLPSIHRVPNPGEDGRPAWRRIEHDDYPEINWSYKAAPSVACNGIVVVDEWVTSNDGRRHDYRPLLYEDDDVWLPLRWPNLSVLDPNGRLPLDLTRTELDYENISFAPALRDSVICDILAHGFVRGPTSPKEALAFQPRNPLRFGWETARWAAIAGGFALPDPAVLSLCGVQRLFVLLCSVSGAISIPRELANQLLQIPSAAVWLGLYSNKGLKASTMAYEIREFLRSGIGKRISRRHHIHVFMNDPVKEALGDPVLPVAPSRSARSPLPGGGPDAVDLSLTEICSGGWLLSSAPAPNAPTSASLLERIARSRQGAAWIEVELGGAPAAASAYGGHWAEFVGRQVIPYSQQQREVQLENAYTRLNYYIEAWQRPVVGLRRDQAGSLEQGAVAAEP